jgi:hypothetical protein
MIAHLITLCSVFYLGELLLLYVYNATVETLLVLEKFIV